MVTKKGMSIMGNYVTATILGMFDLGLPNLALVPVHQEGQLVGIYATSYGEAFMYRGSMKHMVV